MRRMFAVSMVGLLANGAIAAPGPEESWGKARVSLEQYRQDAIDCATEGYYLDISKTEDAKEFVHASRELNNLPGPTVSQTVGIAADSPGAAADVTASFGNIQQHIIESVRPRERFKNIKQMQLAKTDECLVRRGYSKFRLTDDQRRQLRHLKAGSDARRAYLYSLASNPAVLQSQRTALQQ